MSSTCLDDSFSLLFISCLRDVVIVVNRRIQLCDQKGCLGRWLDALKVHDGVRSKNSKVHLQVQGTFKETRNEEKGIKVAILPNEFMRYL
jgi:hypothetical protein